MQNLSTTTSRTLHIHTPHNKQQEPVFGYRFQNSCTLKIHCPRNNITQTTLQIAFHMPHIKMYIKLNTYYTMRKQKRANPPAPQTHTHTHTLALTLTQYKAGWTPDMEKRISSGSQSCSIRSSH
jgi:hypothetical protein